MEFLNSILKFMSTGIVAGGTLYGVIGGVQLGLAIKDHQGPAIQSAIFQIVGAAMVIACGAIVANINFGG